MPADGTPSAQILPDGRTIAQVPDPTADPVLTGDAFRFTQNRDMLTYATELMTAIEAFVDSVLDAFAANRPARAGLLPAPAPSRPDRADQQVIDDPAPPK
jgi:hypothetical protein